MARKTFKSRIRKNDLKQRHNSSVENRKRLRISRKNNNRQDNDVSLRYNSAKSMEELLEEVTGGGAVASMDTLDPRSLANMLMQKSEETGRMCLSSEAQVMEEEEEDEDAEMFRRILRGKVDDLPEGNSRNQYKHKGGSYVFWKGLGVSEPVLKALKELKFTHPTPVQEEVLPAVMLPDEEISGKKGKKGANAIPSMRMDTVVSAETGSGKTLVFALPVIKSIIDMMTANGEPVLKSELGVTQQQLEKVNANEKLLNMDNGNGDSVISQNEDDQEEKDLDSDDEEDKDESESDAEEDDDDNNTTNKKTNGDTEKKIEKLKTPKSATAKHLSKLNNVMHTLVVSPTRELAIQIKATFDSLVKHTTIRVGCVVGGMAPTKQQRVLNRCPHVLICTPGRLWELTQKNEGCYLGHSISRRLHYVILDEADKLLQGGNRFEELKKILERVHCDVLPTGILDSGKQRKDHYGRDAHEDAEKNDDEDDDDEDSFSEGGEEGEWDPKTQKFIPKGKIRSNLSKAATAAPSSKYSRDQARPIHPPPPPPTAQHRVTTYVTSATLSLQTNYTKRDLSNKKQVIRTSNANNMQKVLQDLGIREHLANVFNLSPETGVVSKIQETYLRCPEKSKELYLYYFLRTYKERTLIFVNAISMLRRLVKILGILNIPCVALHASMQQRQRLKFIDRFKKGEKLVLIATDVASRGLDVEGLRYVIHYQVPRSTDAYIHRCGRTARCGGTGMSVMMVDATEHSAFKKLHESLGRTQSQPMEVFALEPTVVHHLHPHLQLAIQIDKLQREIDKATAGDRWVNQMSEAAELDADDMKLDEEQKLEFNGKSKALKKLRKALEAMVKKDTSHRGGKGSYRTSAKAVGVMEATKKLKERADRQSFKGSRHI